MAGVRKSPFPDSTSRTWKESKKRLGWGKASAKMPAPLLQEELTTKVGRLIRVSLIDFQGREERMCIGRLGKELRKKGK